MSKIFTIFLNFRAPLRYAGLHPPATVGLSVESQAVLQLPSREVLVTQQTQLATAIVMLL